MSAFDLFPEGVRALYDPSVCLKPKHGSRDEAREALAALAYAERKAIPTYRCARCGWHHNGKPRTS